jgi:outer membrane protein TolC
MQIRQLELSLENSQINYNLQKLSIERSVTQQFLGLYSTLESVKIAQEELKNATESYQIIESKVKAGITAPEELYQADLTRLNSVAGLENKQMSYENALDNFKILLGVPLTQEIEVIADIRKQLAEVDLQKAVDYAQANRMELRTRNNSILTALDNLIKTDAENEFKASIDVSLGLTGVNKQFQSIYESSNTDKQIAVSLNIPVFDWGQKTHRLAASQASVDTQRMSFEEYRKQITLEIRQAYRTLQNQKRQIEIVEINVQNAQRTYDINLERYKNGDLSSKDMQFYQLQLSQQRLNQLQSLINYKLALLDIKIRSLWDFENNRSVIDNF